jgi:putative SOS response-associated peptidase YedK
MCGKFTMMMTWREYCALAAVNPSGGGEGIEPIAPDTDLGTMTPMRLVPVVHLGPVGQRRITAMRWGWVNPGAQDPHRSFNHLHARAETIDTAPTWAESFRERRGAILTKAFNIGEELPNGKIRQWVCSREDNGPVAIAVIYDTWTLVPGRLTAFAMVTTESCPPLSARDSRMPALLDLEDVPAWIGERAMSTGDLKALLRPYAGSLVIRPQDPDKERNTTRARPKQPREDEPTLF